jgi:hypothetical protein
MGLSGLESILVPSRLLLTAPNNAQSPGDAQIQILIDATALIHYLWFQQYAIDWIHGGEFLQ